MVKNKFSFIILITFSFSWLLLCLYSFSQKDLNLTIFNIDKLQPFYEMMTSLGYYNRPFSTYIFLSFTVILLICYYLIIRKITLYIKQLLILLTFILITSIPAQPMFSHDIYNYIFNAKMVLTYHVNPHVQVALDFPSNPWLRFMHNVHTPAPYGYGWTILSLIPYSISHNNFTLAYLLMKLFVSSLFILEIWIFYHLAKIQFQGSKAFKRTLILALNPLLLSEIFITGHNDSTMMLPVLLSFYLLLYKPTIPKNILAWVLWAFSVTTKYASVILAPMMIFRKRLDIFTWGGIALLAILLTRPGQLHSWYLHWGMVLLLLSKKSWAVSLSLLLTIGGLLRYAPYTWFGDWNAPVPFYRWLILLLPLLLLLSKKVRNIFN